MKRPKPLRQELPPNVEKDCLLVSLQIDVLVLTEVPEEAAIAATRRHLEAQVVSIVPVRLDWTGEQVEVIIGDPEEYQGIDVSLTRPELSTLLDLMAVTGPLDSSSELRLNLIDKLADATRILERAECGERGGLNN